MGSGHGWLAGNWPSTGGVLDITAAAWTARFQWWHSGNIRRTQNVSDALCLVFPLYKLMKVRHISNAGLSKLLTQKLSYVLLPVVIISTKLKL